MRWEKAMAIFVKHDHNGKILSVLKIDPVPKGINQPYGLLRENEFVLEIPVSEEILWADILQIHKEYIVDMEGNKLIKKN
jgi:glycyl-tRNA synthetase beta subunit